MYTEEAVIKSNQFNAYSLFFHVSVQISNFRLRELRTVGGGWKGAGYQSIERAKVELVESSPVHDSVATKAERLPKVVTGRFNAMT